MQFCFLRLRICCNQGADSYWNLSYYPFSSSCINKALTLGIQHSTENTWHRLEERSGDSLKQSYSSGQQLWEMLFSFSLVWFFVTPWTAARHAFLSFTTSRSLLILMSIKLVMPSKHLVLCPPLLLLSSVFPNIRVLSNELTPRIRWPEHWSVSFSISPSNEYSGLISFRIDWFDLLANQGTLKSLLQCYSSKAWILWHPAFFMVQIPHPYMTTGKTIALTRRTFSGKVTSLLFNTLPRFVIGFLLRSKHLLISCLQSPASVLLEPKKIKSVTVSVVSQWIWHEVIVPDAMILVFWMLSFEPAFSLFSFTFIKRLFSSSSLSAVRVVSSAYLRLLVFLPAILISACDSSSPAFHINSACKLNKQGDNIQPWHTPFPIWNQTFVPCPALTGVSWPAYRFLRRQAGLVFLSVEEWELRLTYKTEKVWSVLFLDTFFGPDELNRPCQTKKD